MSVSEQRAFEILGINKVLFKEKTKMDKVSGIIESREISDVTGKGRYAGQVSQKIALTVNGRMYSTFSNAVPAEVAERLGALKQGDEVDLTYTEKPGTWGGKQVTYYNILDVVRVDRVSPGVSPGVREAQQSVQPSGPAAPQKKAADPGRDDMMRMSYSKDTINTIITRGHLSPAEGETEELFIARVFSLIKAGAKTLGE